MRAPVRRTFVTLLLTMVIVLQIQQSRSDVQAQAARPSTSAVAGVLANGLAVANDQQEGTSTFAITVAVRAGSRDEGSDFRGGAHWLEHLFFLGSGRYPTQQ